MFNLHANATAAGSSTILPGLNATTGTAERFILLRRPEGVPDESNFGLEKFSTTRSLKQNELRLHGLYFSVDPSMRGRMNDAKSYVPAFELNKPLEGNVVARVAESKSPNFKSGDLVVGQLPWSTESVVPTEKVRLIDTSNAMASEYLGALGMTGMAAYFGLLRIGQPKAGETVLVSGAAGAVGGIVGQIAKIKGCRTVGITGSDESFGKAIKSIDDCFGRFAFSVGKPLSEFFNRNWKLILKVSDDKSLHQYPSREKNRLDPWPHGRVFRIIERDLAAKNDSAINVHVLNNRVRYRAAYVVEINIHAIRTCLPNLRLEIG